MREVFKITKLEPTYLGSNIHEMAFFGGSYKTYGEAMNAIADLPAGKYQVQKVIIVEEKKEES